jgi:condensation domain-containing protein
VESTPLSFQQQFHWDNAQRLSDLNLNFPCALLLTGSLDIERLRGSLERVVRRHAALRTRIVVVNGEPRQVVDTPGHFRLEVVSRPQDVTTEVEVYLNSPFNLVGGRLLRARLLRLSSRQHILLVCAHHLIMDAFSVHVLANELWHCYATRSPRLPALPLQYADYARQQRATHPHWLECHGTYWSERLATAVPLRLPTERAIPVDSVTSVGTWQLELEGPLVIALHNAARRWQTIPALLMLTAFIAVLSRWSGQEDFVVPLVFAGRDDPDCLELIGFFSYVLLLRVQLRSAEGFRGLLSRVSREFWIACEREDHGRVVTGLLARLPAREGMKLFSTSFNWLSMSAAELAGTPSQDILGHLDRNLTMSPFPFQFRPRHSNGGEPEPPGQGNSCEVPAIGLQVTHGSALEASLLYSAGSLSPHSIAKLAEKLLRVLEQAVA